MLIIGIFWVQVGIDVLLCEHDKKENEKAEPACVGWEQQTMRVVGRYVEGRQSERHYYLRRWCSLGREEAIAPSRQTLTLYFSTFRLLPTFFAFPYCMKESILIVDDLAVFKCTLKSTQDTVPQFCLFMRMDWPLFCITLNL